MTMNQPLLTIAIPTYNRAVWLDCTLDILRREVLGFGDQIEVLVSNNASTDDTAAIIARHRSEDGITFFEQAENIGAVRNIQFLTKHARGKYLWVLGDDDFIYHGFLSRLLKLMVQNLDAALIFVHMKVWFPTKEITTREELSLDEYREVDYTRDNIVYERYSKTASLADPERGYFNAIGNIILLKEDYANAFDVGIAAGPEFTSIESTFPHAYYIAHHLLSKPCLHISSPGLYCSHAVSWRKYYEITYLKWYPELFMLMVKFGADKAKADKGRRDLFPRYADMISRVLARRAGNHEYFSVAAFVKNNYQFPEFWKLPFQILNKLIKYVK